MMVLMVVMVIIQEHGGDAAEAKAAGISSTSTEGEQHDV